MGAPSSGRLLPALAAAQVASAYVSARHRDRATRTVVALTLAWSAREAVEARGRARALALLGSAAAIGWTAEAIGTATGRPFGRYAYGPGLGPRIGRLPLAVGAAWAMMARPAWEAAGLAVGASAARPRTLERAAVAAWALTAWDVFLDPRMVRDGLWTWHDGGRYEDVPASNYGGWLLTSGAVYALWGVLERTPAAPAVAVEGLTVRSSLRVGDAALGLYAWTWVGETIANLVVWRRPRVAAAGFAAMGAVAAPALARRLGAGRAGRARAGSRA